jgi:hypothetical protein
MQEVVDFLKQFGGITATGVLLIVVWMFMRGMIVPARHLDDLRRDRDKILEHKDEEIAWWRGAYEQQAARGDKQEEALRECLEVGRHNLAFMQSLNGILHQKRAEMDR